jgi:hypothetical protein
MKSRNSVILGIFVLALILGTSVFAQNDFKMRQRMTVGGRTSESAVMIKGARERTESDQMGMKNVTIMECDLKRTVMINDLEKKYFIQPMVTESAPVAPTTATTTTKTKTKKGGVVTRTLEIIDTGERKQVFGLTARHIKTIMTTDPSADACEKDKQRIETDGWYVDLSVGLTCKFDRPTENPMNYRENAPACVDQSKFIQKGTGKLGYALNVTTKISMPGMGGDSGDGDDAETKAMMEKMGMGGGMMTMNTEILELSKATLPQSLFEIPAGYTEVSSQSELYGKGTQKSIGSYAKSNGTDGMMPQGMGTGMGTSSSSTAKKPGTIRVGVMPVTNSSGKQLSTVTYRMVLESQIKGDKIEAVDVGSADDSRRLNCDYILTADIKALKQSAAGKIGGMFGKVTGAGGGEGKTEATVGYDLKPMGSDGTTLSMQTTTAKIEGDDNSIMAALGNVSQAVMKAIKK